MYESKFKGRKFQNSIHRTAGKPVQPEKRFSAIDRKNGIIVNDKTIVPQYSCIFHHHNKDGQMLSAKDCEFLGIDGHLEEYGITKIKIAEAGNYDAIMKNCSLYKEQVLKHEEIKAKETLEIIKTAFLDAIKEQNAGYGISSQEIQNTYAIPA